MWWAVQALPTLGGAYVGVLLFKPDNTKITDIKTQEQAREFFQVRRTTIHRQDRVKGRLGVRVVHMG